MRKKLQKLLASFLVLCLTMALLPFGTVSAAVQTKGSEAITRGQVCEIINDMLGAAVKASDMKKIVNYKKSDAYYATMAIAYNAGYIKANSKHELGKATEKATYNYAATILSRILKVSKSKLTGNHTLNSMMTEKQFRNYLSSAIPNTITKNLSDKQIKGNAIINKPDVTLSNVTIEGNLIIGDGVADKEAILDNVTVKGKLVVRGGGENSIKILGTSNISSIDIIQVNNKVSIKVSNDANVTLIYISDGCEDVILNGPIGTVKVTGNDINVSTKNASISSVILNGENTSFTVSEDTVIKKVELSATAVSAELKVAGSVQDVVTSAKNSAVRVEGAGSVSTIAANESAAGTKITVSEKTSVGSITSNAQNTAISGDGKVEKATLNGSNSTISTPDTKVTVGKGATGVEDNTAVKVTPTPTTPTAPTAAPTTVPVPTTSPVPTTTLVPTTTPVPTGTPTPAPSAEYPLDARFETGYPQVILGEVPNSATKDVSLKLKLKEGVASEESPAYIYYIVSNSNTSWDASSEAVMHGHLGITNTSGDTINHELIYSSKDGAVKVTGTGEITVPANINIIGGEELVAYFVIKTAESTSAHPYRIKFGSDTVSSFVDNSPPYLDATYWSKAVEEGNGNSRRTVRVYVNEVLNTAANVSKDTFTVSTSDGNSDAVSGAAITAVSLHKNTVERFKPYQNWIDLTLEYPSVTELSKLVITYIPPNEGDKLEDVANIPHSMAKFSLYRDKSAIGNYGGMCTIKDAEPAITSISASSDGKYLGINVSPKIMTIGTSEMEFTVKVNGVEWPMYGGNFSYGYCHINIQNKAAEKQESSYTVEIASRDGGILADAAGDTYNSINQVVNTIEDSTLKAQSAELDMAKKKLTVTYQKDGGMQSALNYGCLYVLTVDGVQYRLRSRGASAVNQAGELQITFDENCMFGVDFAKVTTNSEIKVSLKSIDKESEGISEVSGKPLDDFDVSATVTGL